MQQLRKLSDYFFARQRLNSQVWFSLALLSLMTIGNNGMIFWGISSAIIPKGTQYVESFSLPNAIFTQILGLMKMSLPFVCIYLASIIVGNDYSSGMVRVPVMRGFHRGKIFITRWGVILVNVFLGAVIGIGLGIITLLPINRALKVPNLVFSSSWVLRLTLALLVLLLAASAYVAIASFVATIFRSASTSLVITLTVFLLDVLISDAVQIPFAIMIKKFLLYSNFSQIIDALGRSSGRMPFLNLMILLLYSIVFLISGLWVFMGQDIHE